MGDEQVQLKEGWARPKGSTAYHFFRNQQSLCERPRKGYHGVLQNAGVSEGLKCQNCLKALGNGSSKTAFVFVRERQKGATNT